ncbi:class F sortase [Rothia sp. ZJ932]|uniref:class F sortase n=1 Tax=Rothia sp. ZJ932 TaxID=2810516 RepID=UPI0019677579|nr:class F sortase [Rothia sp. ZJ932]QRZ61810.1 class F sortase [Rothia sp. ZJ932]
MTTNKNRVTNALISCLAIASIGTGTLALDHCLDGQHDILQSIALAPSYGTKDFYESPTTATDSPNLTVTGQAASPVAADSQGMPADATTTITLEGISPGGGIGPAEHNWDVLAPLELSIPEVNLVIPIVESPLVEGANTNEYEMVLPVSYQAGWLNTSAPLDATEGTTTIAGHVNWSNGNWAPMSNLYKVKPGMIVRTTSAEGTITKWRIDDEEPQTVKWEDFSTHYSIEATTGPRKLVLATCDGVTNSYGVTVYDSNYVVTATAIE